MELMHIERDEHGKGSQKETITHRNYFFDKTTKEVILVTIKGGNKKRFTLEVNKKHCYKSYQEGESYEDREVENRVLKPNEIPATVRIKIDALLKAEK